MESVDELISVDEDIVSYNGWVKWVHMPLSPNHCQTCLKLHDNWFQTQNHPQCKLHEHCHCKLAIIPRPNPNVTAFATCDIKKFTHYIFADGDKSDGKRNLFEHFGYYKEDSEYLQKEFESQAIKKYCKGEYRLGKLNEHGQRISIEITLVKNNVVFNVVSGWMVYPNGSIVLTTPLGDRW